MFVKLCALGAILIISANSQSFPRFENLATHKRPSRPSKFNISSINNGTDGFCSGLVNSTLCEIRGRRLANEAKRKEIVNGRSGKHWYENIPLPPVAVATSNTIPEGACKRQLKQYINALNNGTMWATQMYDASAKYPYGIIDGYTQHLGSFDQCLRIDTQLSAERRNDNNIDVIQGRYCIVDFKYELRDASSDFHGKLEFEFDPNASAWEAVREKGDFRRLWRYVLQMGLCIPASCSAEDIQKALQGPYEDYGTKNNVIVKVNVNKKNCQAYHEEPPFSTGATVYCSVIFSLFALVIISSLYDGTLTTDEEKRGLSRGSQLLLCFSARRNVQSIFDVSYGHRGLDTIHMIRFFSTCIVIVGHRMMQYYFNTVVNRRYLEISYDVPSLIMLHNGPIIVDGFFGIGGLLTCYGLLHQFDKTKRMNFMGLTFIRFLRFTPAYAFLIFFYAYIFPYMGSGPQWQSNVVVEAENCAATWWANLFYLNNYFTMDRLCVFQSWYLSVDFHCYVITVFLIYGFWKWPRKIGYSVLGAATFVAMLIPFYLTYVYRIQPLFIGFANIQDLSLDLYFREYYVKTHMRASAYLVGVIAGAILYDYQKASWRISKRWSQGLFILLVVIGSLYSQSLGFQYFDPNTKPSNLEMALYACLHRAVFAASFCSIVLLITMGDGLDFHYNFLTPRWVQPLSRLSYGVYLSHNIIQKYQQATIRTSRVFTIHNMFYEFVADTFYSFFFAFFIAIGIEGPFRKLEKYVITKREVKTTASKRTDESQIEKKKIK